MRRLGATCSPPHRLRATGFRLRGPEGGLGSLHCPKPEARSL